MAEIHLDGFNLKRYNVRGKQERILVFSRLVNERIEASVGGRIYKDFLRSLGDVVHSSVDLKLMTPFNRADYEEINSRIEGRLHLFRKALAEENIQNITHASKDINFDKNQLEQVLSRSYAGKLMPFESVTNTQINTRTHAGKRIPLKREVKTNVIAQITIGITQYTNSVVNVTIPPGGEIRINSDTFTVMQGQNSILHLYSGEWIYLFRNTIQLKVASNSGGNLIGEIIYSERFI